MTKEKPILDFRKCSFFRMTRAVVDEDSVELKPVDIAVYAVLCMYADNNDTSSYPSVETIAKKARCSERTAYRSLSILKTVGYIETIIRKDNRGFRETNSYYIPGLSNISEVVQSDNSLNWGDRPKWLWDMFVGLDKSCALSGVKENITIDHVLPRGTNDRSNRKGNLLPLNSRLNSSKGNKNIFLWFDDVEVKYGLSRCMFIKAITIIAEQNGMEFEEYKTYYFNEYEKYLEKKGETK